MKKILLLIITFLTISATFAEVDFQQAINETSMPSDSEIRAVISQFNFDEKTKDQLFKETKKKLEEIYSGKNQNANEDLNSSLEMLKKSNDDMFKNQNTKQEVLKEIELLPKK